jgi:hypothetical protein
MDKNVSIHMEKSVTDFPRHDKNPFMQELLYMRKSRNKIVASTKGEHILDADTGEIREGEFTRAVIVERVDNEQFIRVFDNYLTTIFDLSKRALMVLKYTMTALKFNDDRIYFDVQEAKTATGYNSRETIFKGLAELIDKGVLARTDKVNFYFINPKAFVRGNRIDMLKVWVKANSEEDKMLTDRLKQRDEQQKQLSMFDQEEGTAKEAAE